MALKKKLKKLLNYLLTPRGTVNVNIAQIAHGGILKGKRIVITGGGSGLGFSMAKKFVSEGAKVLLVGRNEERLKKAISELGGGDNKYIAFDVTQVENMDNFINEAVEKLGEIDVLVCNAGASFHEGNILNVTIDGYDQQMNVNLRANYFLCQAFVRRKSSLLQRDILLISSLTGNQIYDIPYGMAKAGLNSMVQKINKNNYKSGLRVNAIAPGMIPTEITKSYIDVSDGNMFCPESCGRYFLPEEIAEVATFMLSDASRIIAGEVITCDGGNSQKSIWK